MKCESCGAALSLEVKYCPYCGKENIAARQHVSDMAYYKGAFEDTKKKVYEKTNAYTHNTVKIAVVAILAIVWVGTLILAASAYDIRRAIKEAENAKNYEQIEARIWEYLENEEYYALSIYCYENDINGYDSKFEGFQPILRLTNQYQYIYESLLGILTPSPYDVEYQERNVGYLADYIDSFYQCYNDDWEEMNYDNRYDMSIMQPEMDRLEKKLQVLLRATVNLTAEEVSQLSTMSTGQRILLLEEGLLDEKE